MKLITFVSNMRLARALVVAVALTIAPAAWSASFFVSVNFAPPPIPVYDQPICPGPDYLWIPGYWAWGPEGYYWVPGYWALAPFIGALWTPGWWGWSGVAYLWHPGYWSHHVGYYGGINYGFGYFGVGYSGGHWSGDHFAYNSSVTHVNMTRITNVYNQPVRHNDVRISYNGGQGGVRHAPTPQERIADREAHRAPTQAQVQHERIASRNRELFASVNHGSPRIAATPRADFRAANEGRVVHGAASRSAQVDRFRGERGAMQTAPVQSRANRAPPERQARGFEAPGNGPRPQTFRAERASPRESQPQARYFEGSRGRAEMAQPHGPAFEAPRSRPETIQPQARGFEGPRGRPEPPPQARGFEGPRGRPEVPPQARGFEGPRGRPEAPTQAHAFQQPRGGAQPRAERPPERMAHGEPQGPGGRGRREGERHEGG